METKLKKNTLHYFFQEIVEQYSENPSLAFVGDSPMTYQEFGDKVLVLKKFLLDKGVKKGQKIIILGDNSPNWAITFFAVVTLGAVAVPILSEFPESDINHIIRHSEAVAAFIEEKLFSALDLNALDKIDALFSLDNFRSLKAEIQKEENIWEKLQEIPSKIQSSIKGVEQDKFLKMGESIKEDDLAEILYTSGTTGHSKGVMLTHKNLTTNGLSGPPLLGGLTEESIILNLLPLAHAYGCTTSLLGGLSCGASIYFLDRKPSPKILMDAMQKLRPTIVTGVPLIFEKIYHKKVLPELTARKTLQLISKVTIGRKFLYRKIGKKVLESFGGRLHSFVVGGASLNQEVENFLREGEIPFAIGYGLSECSPLVNGDFYSNLKFGSVGRVAKDVNVKIDEPDSQTGVGEICVKGPNVMIGYYKNKQETNRVFTKDGWLRTGDLGCLDSEGYLFIKGRSKNVYVGSSGENIYPENVEDKLRESLFVEEALAYIEDNKILARVYLDYDQVQNNLHALDKTIQPEQIDKILEKVRKETNHKLPAFSKISRILEQAEPFEKTPTNKIKRVLYVPNYHVK